METFPDLNRPELRGLVASMAQTQTMQMAPYYGGDFRRVPWSPQLRDNIGSAVRTLMGSGQTAPVPYASPPAVVPAARVRPRSGLPQGLPLMAPINRALQPKRTSSQRRWGLI